ncbi:MAG: ATP-binding protein [Kofleriaceae bacterium]|jgi:AAA+ superfamily predicted ATPase|nr:ATP-binding protein [Kofleriaceae bacterium]MBP9167930.1 ATP-binding protein [Kofleriaceae bacterium]MBP9856764.1 ATP-binding protein [Kofleriaceae bacterium]
MTTSALLAATSPPAAEDDYLVRTRALLELAIRRRWAEGLLTKDADGVFTAYLGAPDVERLMTSAPGPSIRLDDHPYAPDRPLAILGRRLGLAASELDLLAVLLACDSDPRAARLATYLGGNQAPLALTFELLLEIVYRARHPRQGDAAAAIFRDLAPDRPLRRLRYVVLDGAAQRVALAQGVRLDGRVAAWLLGGDAIDPELAPYVRLFPSDEPPAAAIDPALISAAVAAFAAGGRLLDLQGPRQSGRELVARHAAHAVGRPLLVVTGRGLGADRMVTAFREAGLWGALLAFTDGDDALAGDALAAFRASLAVHPDTVAIIGARDSIPALAAMRSTIAVRVRVPPVPDRLDLWRHHLGPATALAEAELQRIAATYNLGVSGVWNASQAARAMAEFAGAPIDRTHVADAVRQLFDADLTTIARRIEVRQTWDDLVLPEDLERSVRGIVDRVQHRGQVLGDWGFARKLGKGLGLTVLFAGEPGTGKSMVAGLLAAELGLDLYVVDLSQVASKWLGETEKNLARAFDAAEAGHVLLLFDEADSLLAKRTGDVKSSNDRYANMETNFILARLEQFEGIAFFTTNLAAAIDPAIARRMSVHLQFPYPDAETRELLWQRMIPTQTPIADDLDFAALARRYDLSGGFIRNVALRAAYLAAGAGRRLTMRDLTEAAEGEYRDRGALASGGRLA